MFGRGDGMEEFVDGSDVFQDDGAVAGKEVVGGKGCDGVGFGGDRPPQDGRRRKESVGEAREGSGVSGGECGRGAASTKQPVVGGNPRGREPGKVGVCTVARLGGEIVRGRGL